MPSLNRAGQATRLFPFTLGSQQQHSSTWSWCSQAPRSSSAVHASLSNTTSGVTYYSMALRATEDSRLAEKTTSSYLELSYGMYESTHKC